jgi:hypothetical protein
MVSQKLQRHISSLRSPTRRHHQLKPRSTRTSRFAGRTSTNFSTCRGTAWTHTTSQCTSQRSSQKYDKLHGRPSARLGDVDFSSVKASVGFPLSPRWMFTDGRRDCQYKKHAYASARLRVSTVTAGRRHHPQLQVAEYLAWYDDVVLRT